MTANLADLVAEAARRAPEKVALVESGTGRTTSWGGLDAAVDRAVRGLDRLGLVAGNRVAIATANRVEFVVLYFAVLRAQLVAVPVDPRSATGEMLRIVADSRARLVVADATTVDSVRSVVAGLTQALGGGEADRPPGAVPRLVTLDRQPEAGEVSYATLLGEGPVEHARPGTHDPEKLAVLMYTSGTSGRPRAAMLTHRALRANLDQVAAVEPPVVAPTDVVYGLLPLFHAYGLNAVLGLVVRQRATLVVADGFEAEGALADTEHFQVTVLSVAPPVLAAWCDVPGLESRLRGVRTVLSGSASLAPELVAEFTSRTGIAVHQGYGLTEAGPMVASTLCSAVLKPGSVGTAFPGIELRLVDDTGLAPEGQDPGEILVRGENLFSGYWPDGAGGPVDGWLSTGDLGFLDPDGDLFLVDRLKELIVVSGFNVYPTEVEEVLTAVPGVLEVAVIGTPDEAGGEAVTAYLRVGHPLDDAAVVELEESARVACERRLARFKRPTRIEVVETLPHTVTGKIAKGRLRAETRDHGGPST